MAATASDKTSQSSQEQQSSGHGHHRAHLSFRRRKVKRDNDDSSNNKCNNSNNDAAAGADATPIETATIAHHQQPLPSTISEPSTSSHQILSIISEQSPIEQANDANNNETLGRQHAGMSVNDNDGKHATVGIESKTMDKKLKQKHTQFVDAHRVLNAEGEIKQQHCGCIQIPIEHAEFIDDKILAHDDVSSLKNTLSVCVAVSVTFVFSFVFTFAFFLRLQFDLLILLYKFFLFVVAYVQL